MRPSWRKETAMALMEWNEKFSVGVPSIDEQHKKLVALLNEFQNSMLAKQDHDALAKVLDGLINYAVSHLKYEEDLLGKAGYPSTAEHKKEHERLIKQVFEVRVKYKEGGGEKLSTEVLNFLRKWLLNHIQGSDKEYAPYLQAKGIR
jgi:hemerythrin-like metal-binding protein